MKRIYIVTLATCLAILGCFSVYYAIWEKTPDAGMLHVGFIYENDGSAPYTYNFSLAQEALEQTLDERIQVHVVSNALENETRDPLRELVREGCGIVFACTYSDQVAQVAAEYPDVQFCQVSCRTPTRKALPDNYHTFNAELYQARYVSGIAAGMKLREMIDRGEIQPEEALVGFVGANDVPEVMSSYTAFLLGVRSVAPEARMLVRHARAWCSYVREKECAEALIARGCRIIAQHTHSIGPAVACEEACATGRQVYHVGYSRSMLDIAPTATLLGIRANWGPYVIGAVEAVLAGEDIEAYVDGNVHGNDISAGFDRDWVQMLELNLANAAEDTQERIDRAVEQLRRGKLNVFEGDYIGINPSDEEDSVDLKNGFKENAAASYPAFHYRLKGCVNIII